MRSLRSLLLAYCLLLNAQTPPDQAPKPASVEGIVTNATTGAPIERAHVAVQISLPSRMPEKYGTTTNAAGKFVVGGLPAGSFFVTVDLPGYVMPVVHNGTGENGRLEAGDKKEVRLKLLPAGSIAGRVMDEDGNPVLAEVSADNGAGNGAGIRVGTDEKGFYRIGGLAPGKYRVKAKRAGANPGMGSQLPAEVRTDGTVETFDLTTYFPGIADRNSAAKVSVGSGAEAAGTDIRLVRAPVNHIAGTIVNAPPGATNLSVQLRDAMGMTRSLGMVGPSGKFSLWRLDPGKVRLYASASAGKYLQSAPVDLEVGTQSIENVDLRFIDPMDVSGVVIYEDENAKPGAPPQGAAPKTANQPQTNQQTPKGQLMLRAVNGYSSAVAEIHEDGSFTFNQVQPDIYRVTVVWGGAFVASARLGNVELQDAMVDLRNGSGGATLGLNLSSRMAEVTGTVNDAKGPVAGVRVMLLPTDVGEMLTAGLRTTSSVSRPDGSYQFPRVAPGKYLLLASDDDDALVRQGVTDNYEDILERLEIRPKDQVKRDLRIHAK